MSSIAILFATSSFLPTAQRLKKQLQQSGYFRRVILYTERDLDGDVADFVLRRYPERGGYWIWKPYLILRTLDRYPSATVFYFDSGCAVQRNDAEWAVWADAMQSHDLLLTHYRPDRDYGWHRVWGDKARSVALSSWTKRAAMDYFDALFRHSDWHSLPKLWAGFIVAKSGARPLLEEWLALMLYHDELLVDLPTEEPCQYHDFVIHRHDQSLLSAFAYYYRDKRHFSIAILPETAESDPRALVRAARVRRYTPPPFSSRCKSFIKSLLGEKLVQLLKRH